MEYVKTYNLSGNVSTEETYIENADGTLSRVPNIPLYHLRETEEDPVTRRIYYADKWNALHQ